MNPISILLGAKSKIQVNFELASEAPSSRMEILGYEYLRNGELGRATGCFFEAVKKSPERSIRIADACMSACQESLAERVLVRGYGHARSGDATRTEAIDQLEIISSMVFLQATGKLVQSTTDLSISEILSISTYRKNAKSNPKGSSISRYYVACELVSQALKKSPQRALIFVACLANLQSVFSQPISYKIRYEDIVPSLMQVKRNNTLCHDIKQQAEEILHFLDFNDEYTDRIERTSNNKLPLEDFSTAVAKSLQPIRRK